MPLKTWGIREALTFANAGLVLLESDPRLASNEQAVAGELEQANTLAINALRADDTISPGQRTGRAGAIMDKVFALEAIDKAHAGEFAVSEIYDLMDLSEDCAVSILDGAPTFLSSVGGG
jgi:hypothetical protein